MVLGKAVEVIEPYVVLELEYPPVPKPEVVPEPEYPPGPEPEYPPVPKPEVVLELEYPPLPERVPDKKKDVPTVRKGSGQVSRGARDPSSSCAVCSELGLMLRIGFEGVDLELNPRP